MQNKIKKLELQIKEQLNLHYNYNTSHAEVDSQTRIIVCFLFPTFGHSINGRWRYQSQNFEKIDREKNRQIFQSLDTVRGSSKEPMDLLILKGNAHILARENHRSFSFKLLLSSQH